MSDFELINKVAYKIYPTHLKEQDGGSFSWLSVLPADAKKRLIDSQSHVEKNNAGTRSLTHKLKDGGVLEFNLTKHGKSHIAVAKYQNKGKIFSAIHSHDDPREALTTAYNSVGRRIVKEEVEPLLIEKMAKRVEKKTDKISDKKEKIDTNPTDPESIKESLNKAHKWALKDQTREEGDSVYKVQSPKYSTHAIVYAKDRKDAHTKAMMLHGSAYETQNVKIRKLDEGQDSTYATQAGWSPDLVFHDKKLPEVGGDLTAKEHLHMHHVHSSARLRAIGNYQGAADPDAKLHYKTLADEHDRLAKKHAHIYNTMAKHFYNELRNHPDPAVRTRMEKFKGDGAILKEEQLDELSQKTLGRYVQSAMHDRAWKAHEIGYINGVATTVGTTAAEREDRDELNKKNLKRQNGIYKALKKIAPEAMKEEFDPRKDGRYGVNKEYMGKPQKRHVLRFGGEYLGDFDTDKEAYEAAKEHHKKMNESEYDTDTKTGILANLDYHHGREIYHRQAAEKAHRTAAKHALGSENNLLYKSVARGNETIANHHAKMIKDLHNRFAQVNEDQLNELSPKTLGNYIGYASIDGRANSYMAGSHHAIARVASNGKPDEHYMKQGDKEQAKSKKRHNGIVLASSKLVRKASVNEDELNEISKKTLGSYISKASKEAARYAAGQTDAHHTAIAYLRVKKPASDVERTRSYETALKAAKERRLKGIDKAVGKLSEGLDHEHPDMKAYYAAAKATDEAHLKSIRYRMHNDIKQSEHKTKYDELNNEFHRLKDLEHAAHEKVSGKLLAHHLAPGLVKEEKLNEVEDHFAKIPKGLEWELHHERGFRGSVRSYRSKDGEWEVRPYHTTDYKMEGRLRSVGGTMHKFYAEIRHKDDPIPRIKSFGSVKGENASKVNEKAEKMHAALLKKIPNADKYHTNY